MGVVEEMTIKDNRGEVIVGVVINIEIIEEAGVVEGEIIENKIIEIEIIVPKEVEKL